MNDRPFEVSPTYHHAVADLVHIAETCLTEALRLWASTGQPGKPILDHVLTCDLAALHRTADLDPASTVATDITSLITATVAPDATHDLPASNASGNRRNPSGADALAGSGPAATPAAGRGADNPPLSAPPTCPACEQVGLLPTARAYRHAELLVLASHRLRDEVIDVPALRGRLAREVGDALAEVCEGLSELDERRIRGGVACLLSAGHGRKSKPLRADRCGHDDLPSVDEGAGTPHDSRVGDAGVADAPAPTGGAGVPSPASSATDAEGVDR